MRDAPSHLDGTVRLATRRTCHRLTQFGSAAPIRKMRCAGCRANSKICVQQVADQTAPGNQRRVLVDLDFVLALFAGMDYGKSIMIA